MTVSSSSLLHDRSLYLLVAQHSDTGILSTGHDYNCLPTQCDQHFPPRKPLVMPVTKQRQGASLRVVQAASQGSTAGSSPGAGRIPYCVSPGSIPTPYSAAWKLLTQRLSGVSFSLAQSSALSTDTTLSVHRVGAFSLLDGTSEKLHAPAFSKCSIGTQEN